MLLARARKGGAEEAKAGGWRVSMRAESKGSERRRWRRASSISPSEDRGLGIWEAITGGEGGGGDFGGSSGWLVSFRILRGWNGILEAAVEGGGGGEDRG